jgi:curli biogenesis system outer membrane secretion channel CsgG
MTRGIVRTGQGFGKGGLRRDAPSHGTAGARHFDGCWFSLPQGVESEYWVYRRNQLPFGAGPLGRRLAVIPRFPRSARIVLPLLALLVTVGPPGHLRGQNAKPRIAVLGFDNNSTFSYWGDNLGAAAADELTTQLVRSGMFTVVERSQVNAILEEQHFGLSGAVNPATAAEIGKILGVQAVLTGSITQFSVDRKSGGIGAFRASYTEAESKMDVRLVSTTTAEILAVAEGQGKKRMGGVGWDDFDFEREFDAGLAQEALRPAVENAVEEIVDQAPVLANLAPVAAPGEVVGSPEAGVVYIDKGAGDGIQVGQRFDVYRVVDEIRDSAGNILDQVTEKVGVIEVTRVLTNSSICSVVEGDAGEGDRVTAQGG